MKNQLLKLFLFTLFPLVAEAQWARNTEVLSPRDNIYGLNERELNQYVMNGRRHALIYPVTVTELMIPYQPMKTFFESSQTDPVRKMLYQLAKVVTPFKSMKEVYSWLGVHEYPRSFQAENPNPLPKLTAEEMSHPMGATIMHTDMGEGLTFSCAACHTADLFGVKVMGLTNRFPRANEFFAEGKKVAPYVNSFLFRDLLKATEGERQLFVQAKNAVNYVGPKPPQVLGLDTSLAQVALSLAKRESDAYATKTKSYKKPRRNKLETMVADSKPAVWWTLKYKNRWLSDGSIVSGNPVHTNFLWNEIGRGTDLKKLEKWLKDNDKTIQELTAAVFASKSPRYEKFFGTDSIDIEKAKRGQAHFLNSCAKCHGVYEKGWEREDAHLLSKTELLQNENLFYHTQTPVKDVGTDPGRYLGMFEFAADLNRLQISKSIGTVVEPQRGYVPPPLDGIWARWPYFHNNSVPNLCALLTPGAQRPVRYYAGAAIDKERDFDQECVGYPVGEKTPAQWKKTDYLYDTRREGLSNRGHDEKIFLENGKEIYTWTQKLELIEFLKTL